jgi:branched-chain amino acid transport system substrate-binding protein
VAAAMREIPVDDLMTHNAAIRDDGWVMRESKAPWDYYKLLSKIDAQRGAPPRIPDCKN